MSVSRELQSSADFRARWLGGSMTQRVIDEASFAALHSAAFQRERSAPRFVARPAGFLKVFPHPHSAATDRIRPQAPLEEGREAVRHIRDQPLNRTAFRRCVITIMVYGGDK
jgi:hypothetical protein